MTDLINNKQVINKTSSAPMTTGPREAPTTQAFEAQETQSIQPAFASKVYSTLNKDGEPSYKGNSRNDTKINNIWKKFTKAEVLA
jgi:hypothetical protein